MLIKFAWNYSFFLSAMASDRFLYFKTAQVMLPFSHHSL